MQENPPKILFLFIVILVVSGSFPAPVSAQSENDLTAAEQWVWDQIAAGVLVVDLLQPQFPREEARVLSAAFLEDLLLNPPQTMARQGIHIEHAVFHQPLNLQHVEIPFELWLGHCQFEDKVDLSESSFQKDLSFEGSTFDREVNFAEIYVANDLVIGNGTTFTNRANFRYAEIGANLQANNVQFSYSEKEAVSLRDMHVGRTIWLRNAIFNGQADFRYTQVGTNFNANDAQFNYAEDVSYFGEMKVGEFIFLNRAIFAGPADFRHVQIGRNFEISNAQFNHTEKTAYFGSMRVGTAVIMSEATFNGPVDFRYLQVGNSFEASGAQFNYDGGALNNFSSMNIGHSVFFTPINVDGNVKTVVFAGRVGFDNLTVGRTFEAREAQFNSTQLTSFRHMNLGGAFLLNQAIFAGPVDFRYTDIDTNFEAESAQFNHPDKPVYFVHMRVGDSIRLIQTRFAGPVDFTNLDCSILAMQGVTWPRKPKVDITGMTYDSTEAEKEDLIWLVDQSPFNAQTYRTLENFYESQGYPEIADEVYFAYKTRERTSAGTGFWQHLWNRLFGGFVRYGRRPALAFLWSLLPLAIGTWVFRRREGMVETSKKDRPRSENDEPEPNPRPYYPFLYSLDSFLGPVDLGIEKQWEPKPERKAALVYLVCHKLVGWIFITVALFAVTGLVK